MGIALGGGALIGPELAMAKGSASREPAVSEGAPRVVIPREEGLTVKKADAQVLLRLLDRGMEGLFGGSRDAWEGIVKPDDVVGIKVNGLAGRGMSTRPALVDALVECLQGAGVRSRNIVIWDRLGSDLRRAGFPLNVGGNEVQSYGNDVGGYEGRLTMHRSVASLMARTLTERCSVIINVPVLKDHGICGVTLAMKNFFGAIHNPNKYHLGTGDPYIADLYTHPAIRGKTVLTVADAVSAQCEGGPPFMPHWAWDFGGLMLATDPVAMDTVGWEIIEAERKRHGLPSLAEAKREPTYIDTAAKRGLGTADRERIEVRTV
jgi:uncharacterized protein (DUF362 family)